MTDDWFCFSHKQSPGWSLHASSMEVLSNHNSLPLSSHSALLSIWHARICMNKQYKDLRVEPDELFQSCKYSAFFSICFLKQDST